MNVLKEHPILLAAPVNSLDVKGLRQKLENSFHRGRLSTAANQDSIGYHHRSHMHRGAVNSTPPKPARCARERARRYNSKTHVD